MNASDAEFDLHFTDFEFFFYNLIIELCFEINPQIILSETKQARRMIPRNSCLYVYTCTRIYMYVCFLT